MSMLPVDLDQIWADDLLVHEENYFSRKAPQVALGVLMSEKYVFAELGEE